MEPICFLCQEYEVDIGHQTILCPKQFCKKCHQAGHFAMNCKNVRKDFVTKDEQLVKLENEDETKTETCFNDHPCKVETKTENDITVKEELVKTENSKFQNGEFSKSEEDSLMYCVESISPAGIKKRKIDSELSVEKNLSLEEVQPKIIKELNSAKKSKPNVDLETASTAPPESPVEVLDLGSIEDFISLTNDSQPQQNLTTTSGFENSQSDVETQPNEYAFEEETTKSCEDIPYIPKKPMLHKRPRINFSMDTLDNDKGGFHLLDLIITELKSHMTC